MDTLVREARVHELIIKNKHYRLIIDEILDFEPGQYIEVWLKDKFGHFIAPRPYTISSKNKGEFLELYIGLITDGFYSTHLSKLRKGDIFFYKGPFGTPLKDRVNSKKILLISFGSGISTYRAFIHSLIPDKTNQIKLLYINSHYDDMFYNEELRELETSNSNFAYTSLVTKEDSTKSPKEVFIEILNKLENKDEWNYLLSGPQKAVTEFDSILTEKGIKNNNIICD